MVISTSFSYGRKGSDMVEVLFSRKRAAIALGV
jgi:hypothetical protein